MSRYVKGFFSVPFPKVGVVGIASHRAGQARAIIGRERQAVFPFNEVGRCEMVGRDEGAANAEDLLHPAQFPGHHAHVRCVIAGAEISFGHPLQKNHGPNARSDLSPGPGVPLRIRGFPNPQSPVLWRDSGGGPPQRP